MTGRNRVTCCFFGDGAFAEGESHETANLAALWELPLLLVCENNPYAMGTALARHQAQTDLALRAAGYGIVSWAVDGMDVFAVEDAARRAAEGIRAGTGPHFLEMHTYRFRAHSMYDPDRYRDKAEIEHWKERDPVEGLARRAAEMRRSCPTRPAPLWRTVCPPRSTVPSRPPSRLPMSPSRIC